MKKLNHLDGFLYYEIAKDFTLSAESNPSYFKTVILGNEQWNDQTISELLISEAKQPAFDSGIICAKGDAIWGEEERISQLTCFIAPYQLMSSTIGMPNLKDRKNISKTAKKNKSKELAVGIGMVLSIIAKKGSAESGNRTPHIILIKRENAQIRSNELDAAVVEGLNSGDFYLKEDGEKYAADLREIAKRALEEERGLNYSMLDSLGLLKMPENYYLGYDEQYHQWNFFGTVEVDCTIEELIREGCYFTKDKFESKGIISIPIDPSILYYYLSFDEIPVQNGTTVQRKMWNTAWASILFAVHDFFRAKRFCAEAICLFLKKHPLRIWYRIRSSINKMANVIAPLHNGIDILCAILSYVLVITTLLYILIPSWGKTVTILSTVITSITCLCVVAITRNSVVSQTKIVNIDAYGENNSTTYKTLPETRVFRNVSLVDGNISEEKRELFFAFEKVRGNPGEIVVERKCNVFNDKNELELRDIKDRHIEHICWKIIGNSTSKEFIRFIFPCIIRRQKIVFRFDENAVSHCIDFKVSYKKFVGKDDAEIKQTISNLVKKTGKPYLKRVKNAKINFKFLLKAQNETVIVGFVEGNAAGKSGEPYQLCYDLTSTTFEQKMKDDVTRVACEYAIAEYVGYRMSLR